jgi:hypothetical protein
MNITIDDLAEACLAYDKTNGEWPESKFEGQSVFGFMAAYFEMIKDEYDVPEHIQAKWSGLNVRNL